MPQATPQEIVNHAPPKTDSYSGTGFFVGVKDDRVPKLVFGYPVTNRHVVQPGIEHQNPCNVLNYSLRMNLKKSTANGSSQIIPIGPGAHWTFSDDPSVDLAVTPMLPTQDIFDYELIPTTEMATQDLMKAEQIAEGDAVEFS